MNRFILADDPYDIPTVMCDQHVIKMITEEAQMLCYAIQKHMPEFAACHSKTLFKTTPNSGYAKHPCTQWCATNQTNFEWALDLFQEMLDLIRDFSFVALRVLSPVQSCRVWPLQTHNRKVLHNERNFLPKQNPRRLLLQSQLHGSLQPYSLHNLLNDPHQKLQ